MNDGAWRRVCMSDVVEVNPPRPLTKGETVPHVAMEQLVPFTRRLSSYSLRKFNGSGSRFRNGDTLLARITPSLENGKTSFVSELPETNAWGSTEFIVLSGKESVTDNLFVYYCVTSPQFRSYAIPRMEGTSGRQRVPASALDQYELNLPPLSEQRAIVSILSSLDNKIELNRRMNETLEEMARAIFKSWFVDFDPVRIKKEGLQPVGMDDETVALFPNSFENSQLGDIPKGWSVGSLAEYTDLNPESWSKNTAPNQVIYVDLANTKWGEIEATQHYAWKDAPSRARRILRPRDTIVGTVRPGNGALALVSEEGLTGSTGFAVLRPHKAIYEQFVYLTVTSPENIERLSRLADGAAYPAVKPDDVSATQTVQPNEPLIERFSAIVGPIMSRISANRKETSTLAAIRDTLLPKLLSGEIRVSDAEDQIEVAV